MNYTLFLIVVDKPKLFLLFFQSGLFYVLILGVEGYCCTWSHTHSVGVPWTRDQPDAGPYNVQNLKETESVPSTRFEPAIPANEQSQNYALDLAYTGIDINFTYVA
jgi:hypothetical protein